MELRIPQLVLVGAIVLCCLALTTTAATLALQHPDLELLNTETGSKLSADYSADPLGVQFAPLDPDIIDAAAADELALTTSAEDPLPVEVVPIPRAAPAEPPASGEPRPGGQPTPTQPPAGQPAPTQPPAEQPAPTQPPAEQPAPTQPPAGPQNGPPQGTPQGTPQNGPPNPPGRP